MKKEAKSTLFQFKITLVDSSPSIWRRIIVPSDYSFFDLHVAIQDAMGWTDSHLHAFRVMPRGSKQPICIQYPDPEDEFGFGGIEDRDERTELIADYFGKTIQQCLYEYDFGDGWDHTVLFEREVKPEEGAMYPQCVAGKNACPPENCGGLGGYDRLQKILKDPDNSEHEDIINWLGLDDPSEFDPRAFDPDEVLFDDPREVAKEYELRFGVSTPKIKTSRGKEVVAPQHASQPRRKKPLSPDEVAVLKKNSKSRSGRWEMDWGPEPVSQKMGIPTPLTLTLVVHEESYFILEAYVSRPEEKEKALLALSNATSNMLTLPETIVVRDPRMAEELTPLAKALGCKIEVSRLKVIPVIRRDMSRLL